jgi:hypothetical protein
MVISTVKNMKLEEIGRLIVLIIAVLLLTTPFPGCMVREKTAVRALEKQGYSEVQITSRANYFVRMRGGSNGDVVRFTCNAKNPAGKFVEDVYVFSGWLFKGSTIRTD